MAARFKPGDIIYQERPFESNMAALYKPGEIIHQEKPFAQAIYYSEREKYCECCFKGATDFYRPGDFKLKACVKCKFVLYCSKSCQKASWKTHQLECPHLKNLPDERRDFIRLVGMVLLTVQGKKWDSIKAPVGGVRRSFRDLMSNCHITKTSPRLSLHGLEMARLVKEYLGDANKLNDDLLIELIGKVKHNRYDVFGKGSALYIGASIFEHSCIPNAVRGFDGAQITLRSNCESIITNIVDVTISYTLMVELGDTFAETKKSFYGPCTCWTCTRPYGDSLLTSIVDRTRAFSVIECTESALEKLSAYWNSGGAELLEEQHQALEMLLEMQENVLGDTNLLRIKLLLAKAIFESNLFTKIEDILKVTKCVQATFGCYSEELLLLYEGIGKTYFALTDYRSYAEFNEKLFALQELLYGKRGGRRAESARSI